VITLDTHKITFCAFNLKMPHIESFEMNAASLCQFVAHEVQAELYVQSDDQQEYVRRTEMKFTLLLLVQTPLVQNFLEIR
jgi:hypothetical protein